MLLNLKDVPNKFKSKIKANKLAQKYFGFESGIDVTNDSEVLHRKNEVIKNIIFASNWIYTIIFTFISIGDSSNWLLTILLFPVTFYVNHILKSLIKKGPKDVLSQEIAMYFACFYMILSSIIIYIKLKNGSQDFLKEAGYILLYYSLLITAYYQNRLLFKRVGIAMLITVTILHFAFTYNIVDWAKNETMLDFFPKFLSSNEAKDILLRTLILIMFLIVAYLFVLMTNYMQDERKKELVMRRKTQDEFSSIIVDIFSSIAKIEPKSYIEAGYTRISAVMAKKLAFLYNLTEEEQNEIYDFSLILIDQEFDLRFNPDLNEDEKYQEVKDRSELWIKLIKRNNLEKECETILRATIEKGNDDTFKLNHSMVDENIALQIVLLCDIYVTLRRPDIRYKQSYSDEGSINFMKESIRYYFNPNLFDRFITYQSEFDQIYVETSV